MGCPPSGCPGNGEGLQKSGPEYSSSGGAYTKNTSIPHRRSSRATASRSSIRSGTRSNGSGSPSRAAGATASSARSRSTPAIRSSRSRRRSRRRPLPRGPEPGGVPQPQRRDPQLRVETGAPGVHDLLRRANPHPMKTATVTYTDGRTLPCHAPMVASDSRCKSAGVVPQLHDQVRRRCRQFRGWRRAGLR
jgi:hypothetical protein